MSKKPQSKDEALEALDFIVNVLKEHEKDLDRLVSELGNVTDQLGETGQLNEKVDHIEEKIGNLQDEVTNLLDYMAKRNNAPTPVATVNNEAKNQAPPTLPAAAPVLAAPVFAPAVPSGTSIIFKCKQWEDFQALACQAQTISFTYKEAERIFQADALKGNQIVTYSGELPKMSSLLKMFLSKQLEVPELRVLEGVLTIS
ncbi:MAG: hypothetical protein ACFCUE_01630 [Candidatus Bathyarchaeia archaeon]|jgi:hypothetical protein